jgi:hypothetical protein
VNISIHADNLILSLNKVIAAYILSQALVHRIAVLVLLSGFFFSVSFLSKHICESGQTSGVLIAVAHIVLNVLLYFAAKRLGFFKSSAQAGLQRDLEQLKLLTGEENAFCPGKFVTHRLLEYGFISLSATISYWIQPPLNAF